MSSTTKNTPLVLIIRDGWGENPNPEHDAFNAVKLAETPVADRLMGEYPMSLIATSGEDVGLTEGTMGNSEVGHQNIGAGRVVVPGRGAHHQGLPERARCNTTTCSSTRSRGAKGQRHVRRT
jgi:bisphosphoglycerate-independent phosphoglycerate mutase (AlkP superfamily)